MKFLILLPILIGQAAAFPPADNGYINDGDIEGSQRSPCPAINTLANHGFINRNGANVLTSDLTAQLDANFNVQEGFSAGPARTARNFGLFDTDDSGNEVLNLARLYEHNTIEHDCSFSREDFYTGPASFNNPSSRVLEELIEGCQTDQITRTDLRDFKLARIRESRTANPDFEFTSTGPNTAATQTALLMTFQLRSELDYIEKETLKSFLLFERFPEDYDPANRYSPAFSPTVASDAELVNYFRESIVSELDNPTESPSDCDTFAQSAKKYLRAANPFNW